jgi:hypothetical protein
MAAGVVPFSRWSALPSTPRHRSWARWWFPSLSAALLAMGAAATVTGVSARAEPASGDPLQVAIEACQVAVAAGDAPALRQVQQQLLQSSRAAEPLRPLLARAEALLACRAPAGALQVLDRLSPAPGADRQLWLLMRWQAAQAGLDHRQAADALWHLAAGDLASLAALPLPVSPTAQRPALDLLADHFEALGWSQQAVNVLVNGGGGGAVGAARLGRAAALAQELPTAQRQQLLERAVEQAAEAGAWGLVAQLLDQQIALGDGEPWGSQAVQRRLRLSPRIDDAYGEWQLRPQPELEQRLRSPREPGGHAATPPPTDTSSPAALP